MMGHPDSSLVLLPMNDLVEEVRGSFKILFHVESIEKYHFIIFDTTSDEMLQNYNLILMITHTGRVYIEMYNL